MAEYIGCRNCGSTDCKGCDLKNLETMLNNGKFDCLMNENLCINPSSDVAPVRHARWLHIIQAVVDTKGDCSACNTEAVWRTRNKPYCICPNCGAKMDGDNDA